jgi:transketolase
MPTRRQLANAIRALSMDAVQKANSGHPGMPMGMADIAQVLWADYLRHNPGNPLWPDRDRFVISNGHGSMLLYSLLYLTGYPMPLEALKNFRQLGYPTAGHPEVEHHLGIETTTGPLGRDSPTRSAWRSPSATSRRPSIDRDSRSSIIAPGCSWATAA